MTARQLQRRTGSALPAQRALGRAPDVRALSSPLRRGMSTSRRVTAATASCARTRRSPRGYGVLTGVLFAKPQGVKVTVSDGMVTLPAPFPGGSDPNRRAARVGGGRGGYRDLQADRAVAHARNLSAAVDAVVAGSRDHDLPGLALAPCLVRDALLAQGQGNEQIKRQAKGPAMAATAPGGVSTGRRSAATCTRRHLARGGDRAAAAVDDVGSPQVPQRVAQACTSRLNGHTAQITHAAGTWTW